MPETRVDVVVHAEAALARAVAEAGARLQRRFRFAPAGQGGGAPAGYRLRICDTASARLFSLRGRAEARVSTFLSQGLSGYLGAGKPAFLAVCGLLGLVQLRALRLNPVLIEEDLRYPHRADCLYRARARKQHHALSFEPPYVCASCREFLRCLGLEPELYALLAALERIDGGARSEARAAAGSSHGAGLPQTGRRALEPRASWPHTVGPGG